MKRRQFLQMAVALAAAAGLGPAIGATPVHAVNETAMAAGHLLQAHLSPRSASVIGHAFLQGITTQPRLDHVVHELMRNLDLPSGQLSTLSVLDLRARLKVRTSEEFRLGQIRHVQGWVLGETEAWLCGLAALRPASGSNVKLGRRLPMSHGVWLGRHFLRS